MLAHCLLPQDQAIVPDLPQTWLGKEENNVRRFFCGSLYALHGHLSALLSKFIFSHKPLHLFRVNELQGGPTACPPPTACWIVAISTA